MTDEELIALTDKRTGLGKSIGATGFRVERGAHWPWDYVLFHGEEAIAGISADRFFPAIRALVAERGK